MAAFHGKLGSVTFNGANAVDQVISWTIDATADVAESTYMNAANDAKTYLAGFSDWTATVEALVDDTSGLDPDLATDFVDDDGATLVLHGSTAGGSLARKYTGTAIVTGIAVNNDKDDVISVTYSFQGSGALTETADS